MRIFYAISLQAYKKYRIVDNRYTTDYTIIFNNIKNIQTNKRK